MVKERPQDDSKEQEEDTVGYESNASPSFYSFFFKMWTGNILMYSDVPAEVVPLTSMT
jgi:hypothetical protein